MEIISLALASMFLSLRSMYTLIPERTNNHKKYEAEPQIIEEFVPKQLHLLLNKEDVITLLYAACAFLKQNPQETLTIEKIITDPANPEYLIVAHAVFIEYIMQYTQVIPIPEVWTDQWQGQYIITDPELAINQPIAIQYTLSHKYGQIYFITEQHIVPKPPEYTINGIDLFKWSQFTMRQHINNNIVITEDKLINSIKEF